jgi:hypothetical protein
MADLVAGGGIHGCGAVPGDEPVAAGEPADVTDVGQQPGCAAGADAGQIHQRGPAGERELLKVLLRDLDLLVDALVLGDQVDGEPGGGLADDVALLAGGEHPHPRRQLRRHVEHGLAIVHQPVRQMLADAVATLDRPSRCIDDWPFGACQDDAL